MWLYAIVHTSRGPQLNMEVLPQVEVEWLVGLIQRRDENTISMPKQVRAQ